MTDKTQTATESLDEAKSEAFAEKMLGVLNDAGLAMMAAIGHRTGLFDASAGMKPATSGDIAAGAGLNERYVREWLGAMVTGQIVEYDPVAGTYALPAEHAAWLTRDGSSENIAGTTQWISILGGVETDIVDCFPAVGGVPYEEFARFHAAMAQDIQRRHTSGCMQRMVDWGQHHAYP